MAGLSFYFNEGLYIGGRVTYGLLDIERNEYDISYNEINDDQSYVFLDSVNRNLSIQVTLGFMF